MSSARVLLADDHTIVAEGLASLLKGVFDLVGIAGDGRALVDAARQLQPDVIVADISMPVLSGLDALGQLKDQGVEAKVIFLTMHADAQLAAEAFRAGAAGYLLKQSAGEELITAINKVLQGHVYLTPLITRDLITTLIGAATAAERAVKLTSRQREVLQLVVQGRTMKQIATTLQISTRTAESHKYEMMQALGVRTTAELIQCAIGRGLITS